jgi:salicylate hydroxylase
MKGFGLLDRLSSSEGGAESIEAHNYVSYRDGKVIVSRPGTDYSEREYGCAWYTIHRADYLRVLVVAAKQAGVDIQLGRKVVNIDCTSPSVTLESGEVLTADVIVGADG